MTTYTEILKELQTFRGGEFVPKWYTTRGVFVLRRDEEVEEWNWWGADADDEEDADAFHAHAHIREAAWKAVREWFKIRGWVMEVSDRASGLGIGSGPNTVLCAGPDDATALLAAMKFINGGGA